MVFSTFFHTNTNTNTNTHAQNVGAILRTAFFLGAEGVIWSKTCTDLSATVSKASAGAMEHMNIAETPHLLSFLEQSKNHGWNVMGTALGKNAISASEVALKRPTILMLGNEGHGLRTNVRNMCDELVSIDARAGRSRARARTSLRSNEFDESGNVWGAVRQAGAGGAQETKAGAVVAPSETTVDSLNVSVAAGIVLHRLLG